MHPPLDVRCVLHFSSKWPAWNSMLAGFSGPHPCCFAPSQCAAAIHPFGTSASVALRSFQQCFGVQPCASSRFSQRMCSSMRGQIYVHTATSCPLFFPSPRIYVLVISFLQAPFSPHAVVVCSNVFDQQDGHKTAGCVHA